MRELNKIAINKCGTKLKNHKLNTIIKMKFRFLKCTFLRIAKTLLNDLCGMNLKVKLIQIFILFVIGMLIDFATLLP